MQKVYNAHLSLKARRQQQQKKATLVFSPKNFQLRRKKNGAGRIKYENKEKENNSTHDVLRYV